MKVGRPLFCLIVAVLIGCTPDPGNNPGAGTPSPHPTDHATEAESPASNDGYDY